MVDKVKLIKLSPEQASLAKAANGKRNQPTHAVVCSNYGQLFGTEKQCRKYYSAWSNIFPHLFSGGEELDVFEFTSLTTTQDLVKKLIDAHDQFAQEKIMGEIGNAMVLSMVLIPVGIAFGYFLLKLQGEEQEEA